MTYPIISLAAFALGKIVEIVNKTDIAIERAAPSVSAEVERPPKIEVINLVETAREEEIISQDTPRRCDNRKSRSETKFMIRASRTWQRQYTIQTEDIRTVGGTAAVGVDKLIVAKLELTLQEAVHESFSVTDQMTRTFEQSFEVTVPPGVLQTVILAWKRIWQLGYITLQVDDVRVEVPFRTLVDLDYDQIHETVS